MPVLTLDHSVRTRDLSQTRALSVNLNRVVVLFRCCFFALAHRQTTYMSRSFERGCNTEMKEGHGLKKEKQVQIPLNEERKQQRSSVKEDPFIQGVHFRNACRGRISPAYHYTYCSSLYMNDRFFLKRRVLRLLQES